MRDVRNDPNDVRGEIREYDDRVQWAAVAVILVLVGGLIFAAAFTGGNETQTAMYDVPKAPAIETTGSGGAAQNMPALRMRP